MVAAIRLRRTPFRCFLIPWLLLGVFEVGPSLAGYFKVNGTYNNLGIIDLWLFVLVWPFLGRTGLAPSRLEAAGLSDSGHSAQPEPAEPIPRGANRLSEGGLAFFSSVFLLVSLFPVQVIPVRFFRFQLVKFPPVQFMIEEGHYQYCETYEKLVADDYREGKRILVPHGTMVLIRAGDREVPLDRINSVLELRSGGMAHLAGTAGRIRNRYYDRIYMPDFDLLISSSWYGDEIVAELEANYQEVERIGDVNSSFARKGVDVGLGLMTPISILEPKP